MDVTHLSEDFYEEFAALTARLRQSLTWKEYRRFYNCLEEKDLRGATRFLEIVNDERGTISFYTLAQIRKESSAWNAFYRTVKEMTEEWEQLFRDVCDWIVLMNKNGGSKRAGKLVRKDSRELPAATPVKIAVLR